MAGNNVTGDLIIITYLKVITKIIKTLVKSIGPEKTFFDTNKWKKTKRRKPEAWRDKAV